MTLFEGLKKTQFTHCFTHNFLLFLHFPLAHSTHKSPLSLGLAYEEVLLSLISWSYLFALSFRFIKLSMISQSLISHLSQLQCFQRFKLSWAQISLSLSLSLSHISYLPSIYEVGYLLLSLILDSSFHNLFLEFLLDLCALTLEKWYVHNIFTNDKITKFFQGQVNCAYLNSKCINLMNWNF